MTRRQRWTEYITNGNRVAKYLTPIASSEYQTSSTIQTDALEDFLRSLSTDDDRKSLADAFDFCDQRYWQLARALPRLMRTLSANTLQVERVVGPGIRGQSQWVKTHIARRAGRITRTQWVVRMHDKNYDTPENALLVALFHDIVTSLNRLSRRTHKRRLPMHFEKLRDAFELALHTETLRGVKSQVSELGAIRAKKSKNKLYVIAAELYRNRLELRKMQDGNLNAIVGLISSGWFEPINEDTLFEIYCLCKILEFLEAAFGFQAPIHRALVLKRRPFVAAFQREGVTALVYYQQSPAASLALTTHYTDIIGRYENVTGKPRRPDFVVEFKSELRHDFIVLECKNTAEPKTIADGIYQVLAYQRDFERMWPNGQPKAALLVSTNIRLNPNTRHARGTAIICPDDDESVNQAMKALLCEL